MISLPYIQLLFNILIPLIIGVWALYYLSERVKKDKHILSKGVTAEGTIFDFADSTSYDESSSDSIRHPIIRFVTQKEEWITEQYHIAEFGMKIGDKVKVTYDPDEPRTFLIEARTSVTIIYILCGLVGVGGIVCGLYQLIDYLLK